MRRRRYQEGRSRARLPGSLDPHRPRLKRRPLLLEPLEPRLLLASNPIVSEFLADNEGGLRDSDGNYADWIEIYNPDSLDPVDLTGWQLRYKTDKYWSFPAMTLGPGEFRIVFATGGGTSRTDPNGELHADFNLDKSGARLRLLDPAGVAVQDITWGAQQQDISYGVGQEVTETKALAAGAATRFLVPDDGVLGSSWTAPDFDDSAWSQGSTGIGVPNSAPGFDVWGYKSSSVSTIGNLAAAQAVIDNPANQSWCQTETVPTLNYYTVGGRGHFLYDRPFPGLEIGNAQYNYVAKATGTITVPTPGYWTFGVSSDDGFRLTIPGATFTNVYGGQTTIYNGSSMQYDGIRTAADSFGVVNFTEAGKYVLEMLYFQGTSSAEMELFAAPGMFSSYGGTVAWRLVGDSANGGLAVECLPFTGPSNSIASLVKTNVAAELAAASQQTTLYTRTRFDAYDWQVLESLTLKMAYDDGYVAWINGVEVARRNAPASVTWESQATATRPSEVQSSTFETIDISALLDPQNPNHLKPSGNVLAVQVMKSSPADPDMLLVPEIAAIETELSDLHFFSTPSPGAANSREFWQRAAPAQFSVNHGFYDAPFTLELSTETAGSNIYYTLDSSAPWNPNVVTSLATPALKSITSGSALVRNGSTATATITNHGYLNGQVVTITGALQPEYNGTFVVCGVQANSFSFTVPGTPITPATGTLYAQGYPLLTSGDKATLLLTNHGYSAGTALQVSGSPLPECNGVFTIYDVTADTFSYTVGAPLATPITGSISVLKVDQAVASIAAAGTTATATVPNHGYAEGDLVRILGANEPEFNRDFIIHNVTADTFDFSVRAGAPSAASGLLAAIKLGRRYVGPISITTTTTVRACVYNSLYEPSNSVTQSYIFIDHVINQPADPEGFPPNWGAWPADYQMDPRVTQDPAYAGMMRDALLSLPTISIVSDRSNFFDANTGILGSPVSLSGGAWDAMRAPSSIEYIEPGGNGGFQINAAVQVYGGASRGAQLRKHGMRIVFRSEFGPTKLEYPLFGDGAADEFDSLVLRCSYGDQWTTGGSNVQFIKDAYASAMQLALGQPSRHSQFVHVYIDGLYWGTYDMGERPDASFASSYMGGDKDDWEANNAGLDNDTTMTIPYWNALLNNTKVGFSATTYAAGVPGFNTTFYAAGASETPGFTATVYRANVAVTTLAEAESVIVTSSKQVSQATGTAATINYLNTGADGRFPNGNNNFPGMGGTEVANFVVEITSTVTIPTSGYWTFGASTNDGFKCTLTNGTDTYTISNDSTRSSPADRFTAFNIRQPGDYRLRLVYFQNTGGAELELFAAPGNFSAWTSTSLWRLVGDTASGGLASYLVTPLACLADAEAIIADPGKQNWVRTQTPATLNYINVAADGHYAGGNLFPSVASNTSMQSFVVKAESTIAIPSTGNWTFAVSSDDGFRLTISDGPTTILDSAADGLRTAADTFKTVNFTKTGYYTLRLVYYQGTTTGAELELFATKGAYSSWGSATTWQLVGNNVAYTSTSMSNAGVLTLASLMNVNNLADAESVINPPSKAVKAVGDKLPAVALSRVGSTATMTLPGHGFVSGQVLLVSGAEQTQYNGTFAITVLDEDRFCYTVSGSPPDVASGSIAVQPYGVSRLGAAAIVWLPGHAFSVGDYVRISGAGQGDYNGVFPILAVDGNSFSFMVSNAPTSPGTGTAIIASKVVYAWTLTQTVNSINYCTTGSTGHFANTSTSIFPGLASNLLLENFVFETKTSIYIPTAGPWTFGVNSDEGFRLELTGQTDTFSAEFNGLRTPADTLTTFDIPAPGMYRLRLVHFQKSAGAAVELFAAPAAAGDSDGWQSWGETTAWRLVGDMGGLGTSLSNVATVTTYLANVPVTSLDEAQRVVDDVTRQVSAVTEYRNTINLAKETEEGHFSSSATFPGVDATDLGTQVDNFVVRAQSAVVVPSAGVWWFAVSCDDGFRLTFYDGDVPLAPVMQRSGVGPFTDAVEMIEFPRSGSFTLELLYYQHVGGAGLELSAARASEQPGAKTISGVGTKTNVPNLDAAGITRDGATATVAMPNHGFADGAWVLIGGADQAEYNGLFAIRDVTPNGFSYTVPGTPATPSTGVITAARTVAGITRSGATATVTMPGHGYSSGNTVVVSGAEQPEYNGVFTIAGVTGDTFTYALPADAESPATGTITASLAGLTRSGSVVTVTMNNHGFSNGATVLLTGADQPEYNGYFTISVPDVNRFTYVIPGAPVSPATGVISVQSTSINSKVTVSRTITGTSSGAATAPKLIGAITRSGTLATVICVGHGFSNNNLIVIGGADQAEYNGTFAVTVVDANTFTFFAPGEPASPATGTLTAMPAKVYTKSVAAPKGVVTLTRSGTTATVTLPSHGFSNGSLVLISGADQPEYNGASTITYVNSNSFTYTLPGATAASPATGAITAVVAKAATITSSGLTATVTCTSHGFSTGNVVRISGANEPEYNGVFAITSLNSNSFTYTLAGPAASPATGTICASATGIAADGATATVTLNSHGYTNGQWVLITGATDPAYNGYFPIGGVTSNSFSYTLGQAPAGPAAGTATIYASAVTITRSSATATLTLNGHGFVDGQTIFISGADQPEYNGYFPMTLVDGNRFTIAVSGTPATPATGPIVVRSCALSISRPSLTSVTRDGTVATATLANHGYITGQTVIISGAGQAQYNGARVIFNVTQNTFDFAVSGEPVSPATGTVYAQAYGISADGSTAIVSYNGHGFAVGSTITITGADPAPYNGTFTVTSVTANAFTYTMADVPDRPASGPIVAWLGGLSVSGTTATLTLPNHGFVEGQTVLVSGVSQLEYNRSFVIFNVTPGTFDFEVGLTPPPAPSGAVCVQQPYGIFRSGTAAIVSLPAHALSAGDVVRIAGADQPQFNGDFTIAAAATNAFTFSISGAPDSPATGTPITAQNMTFNPSTFRLLGDTINSGLAMASGVSIEDMYYCLQGMNPDGTRNPKYPVLLDVDNYIDYLLVTFFLGNSDWPGHNFYSARPPDPGSTGYKFFTWDNDATLGVTTNMTKAYALVAQPYYYLCGSAEFRTRFADRAQKYLFNGGPFTPQPAAALYKSLADAISLGVIGESARWGDMPTSAPPYPHTAAEWRNAINAILTNYFPARTEIFIRQLRDNGILPNVDAPAFAVNGAAQYGGTFLPGDKLTMSSSPAATIYYCLDGSDPRLTGGLLNPAARVYTGQITLGQTVLVKARAWANGTWSALSDVAFYADLAPLVRITELMYHPADPSPAEIAAGYADAGDFEYVEIKNIGAVAVPLAGMSLADGVKFTFPEVTIAPGQYRIVAANPAAFGLRYPDRAAALIAGSFDGRLDNAGETLELTSPIGGTILKFTYKDGWYSHTDGDGFSLTVRDPQQALSLWDSSAGWRSSAAPGGTPGFDDALPNPGEVVINEVLPHTDPPLCDMIELSNTTDAPIDVGGWFVSDDKATPTKYQIAAGTVIPARGYLVLTEDRNFGQLATDPGRRTPFALSEYGDDVYLYSNASGEPGGYREHVDFAATPNGVSVGLHTKATGGTDFTLLESRTFGPAPDYPGAANTAVPYIAPLVISAIMYHPADPSAAESAAGFTNPDDFEYLELYNRSETTLSLSDFYLGDGVGFSFGWCPTGTPDELWTLEPEATATWTTSALHTDTYTVYAHYTLRGGDGRRRALDDAAQYTIMTAAGPVVVTVDQEQPGVSDAEVWVNLGTYAFDGAAAVVLARGNTGVNDWTIAEQVKFVAPGHEVVLANPVVDSLALRRGLATVAPGDSIVLVGNYAAFDARYGVAANNIPVAGVYNGRLDNDGEMLRLYQFGVPDPGIIPAYNIDRVSYGDSGRWPGKPDGEGPALIRVHPAAYGNSAGNWQAGALGEVPGRAHARHDKSPPSVPTSLAAHASSTGTPQILLTWAPAVDAQSFVDHYVVYRDGQFPAVVYGTSYSDTDVQAMISYTYRVSAVNRDGYESKLSEAVGASLPGIVSYGTPEERLEIVFSEPLDPATALAVANYAINGMAPRGVSLAEGNKKVVLTTGAFETSTLLASAAAASVLVPTDGTLGTSWTAPGFSTVGWTPATTGIGFATTLPAEIEPNDSRAAADWAGGNFNSFSGALYQLGLRGTADATGNGDDWFRLGPMQAGDVLTISGNGAGASRGTSPNVRVELYRGTGSGTLVTSDDDSGPGADALIARWTITTDDTYYVKVKRSNTSVASGTYQLGVWLENLGPAPTTGGTFTDETEGNDSLGAANNPSSSWRRVQYLAATNGDISTPADVDHHRYTLSAGDLVSFVVDSTSGLDVRASLLSATGSVVASEDGTSAYTGDEALDAFLYAYVVPNTGTYYLKVESNGATTGSYSANVLLSSDTPPEMLGPLVTTDVGAAMLGVNASAYVRLPFTVADPAGFSSLRLRMKYDDGFVAWLNGTEIARRNAPADVQWNSTATAQRSDWKTVVFEEIEVTASLPLLAAGQNVLAIQILNAGAADGDLLLVPELVAGHLGSHYTVTISNLATASGNELANPLEIAFNYSPQGSGYVARECWTGVGGVNVYDLTNNANYPNSPTPPFTYPTMLEQTPGWSTSAYGSRMRGYLYPPVTGDYTFWISADDTAELWLSLDDNPANKQKIAFVASAGNHYHDWTRFLSQTSAPVTLVAGVRYYFEVLHKQSGSQDHCSVRWRLPDGTWENGNPSASIPGIRLSPYTPVPDQTPPSIPQNLRATLPDNADVRLEWSPATDAESGVVAYRIYRDGVAYGSPVTTTWFVDSSVSPAVRRRYQVSAINADGYESGRSLVLSIMPIGLVAACAWSPTFVQATFSEPLDPLLAEDRSRYRIDGVTVSAAQLEPDGMTVTLTVANPMGLNSDHTLIAEGLRTQTGMEIPSRHTQAALRYGGSLLRELFQAIGGGSSLADLNFLPAYPGNPTARNYPTSFESLNVYNNTYSAERLRGYICPDVSGTYYFWLAADDTGELWLSTNDDPANKVLVASVSASTGSQEWNKFASQMSPPINLVAGQRYYVEAVEKQNSGTDHLAVAWQRPDATVLPATAAATYLPGPRTVASLTRLNTEATVTLASHGLAVGNTVLISGANQPEYNGTFTVTAVTTDTFRYTISGSPATPATGTVSAVLVKNAGGLGTKVVVPSRNVAGITRSGIQATVTMNGHGFVVGNSIRVSGANEPEYNGTFTVASIMANTFTYTVSSSAPTPATGTITAAKAVTSITSAGTTATVTLNSHGYALGNLVLVSGANEFEYNGVFAVTGVTTNTFTYTLASAAASPATGEISVSFPGITRNGSTATVTLNNHGFVTGQTVYVEGANEPEYNGYVTVTVVNTSTFTYTLTGTPASPATGSLSVQSVGLATKTTVSSVTRSSGTVTVTQNGHNYVSGQTVLISGASQADYNGAFAITVLDANRFTYTIPGTPTTPATGTISAQPYALSRSGSTAIVSLPGHGYVNGASILVGGADQAEYNGVFTIAVVNANTFTYAITGTPSVPATGRLALAYAGITRSGTTATVTSPNHRYVTGQTLRIAGAAQPEYNGDFIITVIDANLFTYTVAESAPARATGNVSAQPYGISFNGTTAIVWLPSHGFANSQRVGITGAAQPEYNGAFLVSGVTTNTFTITLTGAPSTPATGAMRINRLLPVPGTYLTPAASFNTRAIYAVDVDPKGTSNATPKLDGTVSDLGVMITVYVDGVYYAALNAGDYTWGLAGGTLPALADGVYDVIVCAVDVYGRAGYDLTRGELTIDTVPLDVSFPGFPAYGKTPRDQVQIVFNGAVTGFDMADVRLTFNDGSDLITGAETLTTEDNITWTLAGLPTRTGDGVYRLRILATSGIEDAGDHELTADAVATWYVDNQAPTVAVEPVVPNPRSAPVDHLTIVFNEPVAGLTKANLSLTLNGGGNLLGASQTLVTTDGLHWTLGNLAGLTAAAGTYQLTVATAGVADLAGNPLAAGTSGSWLVSGYSLDADGDGTVQPLTDGILILRYLFDPGGQWAIADALDPAATRTTRAAIKAYLDAAGITVLDADGNGTLDPLSDGILILRYLFEPQGQWDVADALGAAATRTTCAAVNAFLDQYNPSLPSAPLDAVATVGLASDDTEPVSRTPGDSAPDIALALLPPSDAAPLASEKPPATPPQGAELSVETDGLRALDQILSRWSWPMSFPAAPAEQDDDGLADDDPLAAGPDGQDISDGQFAILGDLI